MDPVTGKLIQRKYSEIQYVLSPIHPQICHSLRLLQRVSGFDDVFGLDNGHSHFSVLYIDVV